MFVLLSLVLLFFTSYQILLATRFLATALHLAYLKLVCRQELHLHLDKGIYTDGNKTYNIPFHRTLCAKELDVRICGQLLSCPRDTHVMLASAALFTLMLLFVCNNLNLIIMLMKFIG